MIPALRTFFRIHAIWFFLLNAGCVWLLFMTPGNPLAVLVKLFGYGVIYLLSRPFASRYNAYFNNIGFHTTTLYLAICFCDFVIFLLPFTISKLF